MEAAGRCGVDPCVNMCELLRLSWQKPWRGAPHHDMFKCCFQWFIIIKKIGTFSMSSPVVVSVLFPYRCTAQLVIMCIACTAALYRLCLPVYIRHVSEAVFSARLAGCWLVSSPDQWERASRSRGSTACDRRLCQTLVSAPPRGLSFKYETRWTDGWADSRPASVKDRAPHIMYVYETKRHAQCMGGRKNQAHLYAPRPHDSS